MNYEAGFCVFAFIVFCCVLVYALYRRALAVDGSMSVDELESHLRDGISNLVNSCCDGKIPHSDKPWNLDNMLSRDDVLELASRIDTDTLESGNSKIPPRPFSPVPERVQSVPKGWQPWEGGFNPFWYLYKSEHESVVVMRRSGKITPPMVASDLIWFHNGTDADILAYRIAE
jgi:hypothetical protein